MMSRSACLLLLTLPLMAQTPPVVKPAAKLPVTAKPAATVETVTLLEQKTLAKLEALDRQLDGILGVTAIDLTSGRAFSYHGNVVTTQASLIKIPILVTAFAEKLDLAKTLTLTEKDAVGGSGTLDARLKTGPQSVTVRELLTLMIRDSDNTATNQVIALVKMERVNALMARLGLPNTRLRRIMMDSAAAKRSDENISTPEEMARLVEMIYRGKVATPDACHQMIEFLKLVQADLRAALPASVPVAAKPGGVPGVHTEAGIVFLENRPYVVSVMGSYLAGEANPIRDVAEIVHAHFTRLAVSNAYGHRTGDPLI